MKAVVMLVGLALLVHVSTCEARAYRCSDTDGNVSYSQSPCSSGQTGTRLRGVGTSTVKDRKACSLVRNFAAESFEKLKRGTQSSMLVDEYGGPGYIDPLTLNVINFVSGFRFSKEVAARKVGAMAYNKCRGGGFGAIQIGDLPIEILPPDDQTTELPGAERLPSQSEPGVGTYTRNDATDKGRQELCQNYEQRISALNQSMRRGYDSANGQRMRKERQRYQALLQRDCR